GVRTRFAAAPTSKSPTTSIFFSSPRVPMAFGHHLRQPFGRLADGVLRSRGISMTTEPTCAREWLRRNVRVRLLAVEPTALRRGAGHSAERRLGRRPKALLAQAPQRAAPASCFSFWRHSSMRSAISRRRLLGLVAYLIAVSSVIRPA